jgi:hypothetical protein
VRSSPAQLSLSVDMTGLVSRGNGSAWACGRIDDESC